MVETHLIEIEEKYSQVSKKTSELYELCEGLMLEERQLRLFGEELRECLRQWETLDSCSHQLHSPSMVADDPHFLPILCKVEEGILFFENRPKIKDGEAYRLKFKQLQNRALTLIRNYLVALFKQFETSQQPNHPTFGPKNATGGQTEATQNFFASNVALDELERNLTMRNAQFRTLAERARPLCEHIAKNSSAREYALLLHDTGNAYFNMRRQALQNLVQGRIRELSAQKDVFELVRHGMIYLAQLSEQEFELLSCLYPSLLLPHDLASTASGEENLKNLKSLSILSMTSTSVTEYFATSSPMIQLKNLLETMFRSLDDQLRPTILRTQNLDLLCSLVDILQYETIDALIDKRPLQLEAMRPIARRLMEDVRDRLIFVTDLYIRDEIANFAPSASDLDYPKILDDALEASRKAHNKKSEISSSEANEVQDSMVKKDEDTSAEELEIGLNVTGEGWYPPLTKTLVLLAKLYVAVDSNTFGGIAQEAVMGCVHALCQASKTLESVSGKEFDATLFLLKYVSILQSNLVAFDVDLKVYETSVDFGAAREMWRRLLKGEVSIRSLFSLSTDRNPLLSLLIASATPQLTQHTRDLRQSMQELQIQNSQNFLFAATPAACHPLMSYLAQSKTYLQSKNFSDGRSIANVQTGAEANFSPASDLASQPFATPEALKEVCSKNEESIRTVGAKIARSIPLYLGKVSNQAETLYNSFKTNLIDTYDNFRVFISAHYAPKDIEAMKIISSADLATLIDSAYTL